MNIDDRAQPSSTIALNSESGSESFPLRSPIKVDTNCDSPQCGAWLGPEKQISFFNPSGSVQSAGADAPGENSDASSGSVVRHPQRPDFNQDIYYRNRTEFGLDVGWHPINIPFVYDFAVGDSYNMTPLKYTLVPIIASLRWHVTNVGWRWIFRGNMDFTFSGSITPIPRGPETHYYSFIFGIRRNFVYRNWKVVPFFEERGGAGMIDAKEPLGVLWAQGQNLTFTYNMGAGVRYNLDSKYSFSAAMNYMHISNGYLSEPQFVNYGINVYGPMFGMNVRLGKPHHHATE
ncbi:MAG: acyloxyacyl hydrolase [Candidatus Sulfotelmatobacter sp.]